MSQPDPPEALNELASLRAKAERLAAQLAEEHKMAELGRLLAGIVHEINSPIGSILSNNQVIIRSLEMLKSMAKIDMLHIPYKGASLALTELIGGQITIYASSMPPALPLINGGKLRALGVTSGKRLAPLPNVPTVAESGVAGYEAVNWYGVLMPARTPKDIVAKVHADIVRVLKQPDIKERFAGEGGDIVANTPDEFGAFIRNEIPKWSKVVKDAGVKVD